MKIRYWKVAAVLVALCAAPTAVGQQTAAQVEPERGNVQVRRQSDDGDANRPSEAGPINGQQTQRQTTQPRDQRSGSEQQTQSRMQRTGASQISNAEIASILIPQNEAEIEVSQWVAQRSKTPEVVNFAEMMVRDHQQVVQQLQQFASADQAQQHGSTRAGAASGGVREGDQSNSSLRRTLDGATDATGRALDRATDAAGQAAGNTRDRASNLTDQSAGQDEGIAEARQERLGSSGENQQQRTAQRQQPRAGTTTQATSDSQHGGMAQSPWVQVHHQVTQRVKQATMEELQSKDGVQLDKAYLGMQIAGHTKMASELAVLQTVAQGELRSLLATAEQKTRTHLQEAKQLMQQMEQQQR